MNETNELIERLQARLRDVPDFPKPGILFKDITPALEDGPLFRALTEHFAARFKRAGVERVVGIESRGFLFGAAIATTLGVGLTLIRKPRKLPAEVLGVDYALEYGTDRVEMHADALEPGLKIGLVDDVLATGGTAAASFALIEQGRGEVVEASFLIEIAFLEGRARLGKTPVYSLLSV